MEQKKLYKTIEDFFKAAPQFRSDEELLTYALKEIIDTEEIKIIGGRIWRLSPDRKSYLLLSQMGDVDVIEENYELPIAQYPMFKEIGKNRSGVAKETDEYLIKKGIYHYSATGVGERYRVRPGDGEPFFLYQYLIALNTKAREEDNFLDTLNIISTTLSSILRAKSIESSAKENIVELEKAREIQKNILPEHEFKFGNFEIFGVSIPEKIVGGDFFDYITSSDKDMLGIAIGDAASKGISAAAQALYVSGALRMGVEFDIRMSSLIKKINSLVYETFPYERFVTLFYCELFNDHKGLCLYVNAGHNRPLLLKSRTGEVEQLMTTGPVLGPSPNQFYTYESCNFRVNDIMIMFTDGIVEAVNKKFEFYGEERLQKVLKDNKDRTPREICELIIEDVQIFSAEGEYADDKTLVVIKRVK
jgi:serine phosphatase RsbU (regulator of sigma subunit)